MKLSDFVCVDAIVPELAAPERDKAIKELVVALEKAGKLGSTSADAVARAVIKRENEASTGIGKGVAVPHVKHKSIVLGLGVKAFGCNLYAIPKMKHLVREVSMDDVRGRVQQALTVSSVGEVEAIFADLVSDKRSENE